MDMNWFETIVYGLLSGLSEFLPVSSQGHRAVLLEVFGIETEVPVVMLFVHFGLLLALYVSTKDQLRRLYREYRMRRVSRRRRRNPDIQSAADISLIKGAVFPLLLSFVFYPTLHHWNQKLYIVSIFLILNGIILYILMHIPTGNKDSRSMSRLDSMLIGLGSMFSVFPGISRICVSTSVAVFRGADPKQAYKWSLFLSYPALLFYIGFDFYDMIMSGMAGLGFQILLQGIVCGIAAFLGAVSAIPLMRFIAGRSGISNFSYYCWGLALFAFILFLL